MCEWDWMWCDEMEASRDKFEERGAMENETREVMGRLRNAVHEVTSSKANL